MPHCLGLPYWHYQLVLTWYLHQPESHQLSFNKVPHSITTGPIDRTPGTPGSDKKKLKKHCHSRVFQSWRVNAHERQSANLEAGFQWPSLSPSYLYHSHCICNINYITLHYIFFFASPVCCKLFFLFMFNYHIT